MYSLNSQNSILSQILFDRTEDDDATVHMLLCVENRKKSKIKVKKKKGKFKTFTPVQRGYNPTTPKSIL